jgi:hypothetical protein
VNGETLPSVGAQRGRVIAEMSRGPPRGHRRSLQQYIKWAPVPPIH